ncbi:hypothetical protein [Rhizobium rhizogenes]|uniref:hypothetical protein n=1 Tax=Rhizobium rhizogenes TaxID=359 RepID=UPI00157422A1|nr:hypothetical protein [Rhizobium rhizogenes]NTI27623.1 hypothetical protein [Rhizobium rhizogenes]
MSNEEFDFEIRKKPGAFDPPPPLFICIICEREITRPAGWQLHARGFVREREPICSLCASHWGHKGSGPVFNRQNFQTLRQLSAMINRVTWEIKNGNRRYR